jgi:hypothetical protein
MKNMITIFTLLLVSATGFAQTQLSVGQKMTIQGQFGEAEGCLTLIVGSDVDSNQKVELCGVTSENTQFTNGATESALTDAGFYYISGTVSGQYADQFQVDEIAKIGE